MIKSVCVRLRRDHALALFEDKLYKRGAFGCRLSGVLISHIRC